MSTPDEAPATEQRTLPHGLTAVLVLGEQRGRGRRLALQRTRDTTAATTASATTGQPA